MRILLTGEEVHNLAEAPSIYEMVLGLSARHCLFCKPDGSYYKRTRFKIASSAFGVWRIVRKVFAIPRVSYYTPLRAEQVLPPIFQDAVTRFWSERGIMFLGDLFSKDGICLSFSDLVVKYHLPNAHFFKYLQIRDYLHKHTQAFVPAIIIENIRRRGKIGVLSQTFMTTRADDLTKINLKWRGLPGDNSLTVETSIELARKVGLTASLQAQHYKTVFNLYHTPAVMRKWANVEGIRHVGSDGKCFRCKQDNADLLHVFCQCSVLGPFINHIERFLSVIIQVPLQFSPSMILLGIGQELNEGQLLYKFRYLLFISTAIARLCVASLWLQPEAPPFEMWRAKFFNFYNLESSLYALKKPRRHKFGLSIWEPVTVYLGS